MPTSTNPNPARVTPALWSFWLAFKRMEPTVKLGGIYAAKPGYHNTRKANARGDYSVQSAKDRAGPSDKSAGIDLTFPSAQRGDFRVIAKYSSRLLRSGRDLRDERGNYLRSFYGNADTDREVEGWDYQRVGPASSDDSHLWHLHLSFIRKYVNDPKAMRAVLSILAGESVQTWRKKEAALLKPKPKPKPGPKIPPPPVAPKVPEKPVVKLPARPPIVALPVAPKPAEQPVSPPPNRSVDAPDERPESGASGPIHPHASVPTRPHWFVEFLMILRGLFKRNR